jgi:hypothetical protein
VLPPSESGHVHGIALDVRPVEGARWLERHGGRHHLYRIYANEWWHFEYQPRTHSAPPRLPHPGAITRTPQSHYVYAGDQDKLVLFFEMFKSVSWRTDDRSG